VGMLPALHAARTDPHDSLKADTRTGAARGARRMRHALIVVEIAFSVVLLFGAGLLLRTFVNLQRVDLGFDPRGVLTMRLTLPRETYGSDEAIRGFFERLMDRVQAAPGVTAVAVASQYPPDEPFRGQIEVEHAPQSGASLPMARTTIASRRFFETLGVPLVMGRWFGAQDRPDGAPVVIVNRAFVDRFLQGRAPIGTRVRIGTGSTARWSAIIGVVGDAHNDGLAAAVQPEVFTSMELGPNGWNQLFLLVRSGRPSSAVLADVRQAVTSIDPQQPVYAIQTLEDAVAASAFTQRTSALLLGIFAAIALVLAGIGIYGVMSYAVGARTQEMGVRMAIGATRFDVVRLVLGQVFWLSAIGLTIGMALLFVLGRALEQLLFGVVLQDPLTIVLVVGTLGAVALLAAWRPAYRASRIDPIQALRYE
jgi:putative ABC transport system permease protein